MAKRKPPQSGEAIIVPPLERWNRGEVERPSQHAIADSDGRPGAPFRAVSTLAQMEGRGSITAHMKQAGEQFHGDFILAGLEPLRAADMARVPITGVGPMTIASRQLSARQRIWEAVVALGGIASPAGCCAWHVLGRETLIKDWAMREGWCGRPIGEKTAAGILIGALGVLILHYGLAEA